MHDIQTHVIHQLILKQNCRYRDIKPKEVEGNLFMYHLRQLMAAGLVEKQGIQYALTSQGLRMADGLSLQTLAPRIQPKIVTLIAVQNHLGKWLLYKRSRQPFFGQVGFPYGKIHLGEKISQAAQRELREKTGLMAELKHRGDAYLTVRDGDEVVSQMLCHIFSGTNPVGRLQTDSPIGECFWADIDLGRSDYFPGFKEIYRHLQQNQGHFFDEITSKAH